MTAGAGGSQTSRRLAVLAAVFLASTILGSGMGAAWAREAREPRINVLGSGNALSVLITAGSARLLLASGDDPVAFANALAQVRHPTTPRIDILLVAGRGRSLLVPIAASSMVDARYVASLGPIPPSPERDALQESVVPVLPSPRTINLGDGVTVEIETSDGGGSGDADAEAAWRLIVRHDATTVVIVSRGEDAERFSDIGSVAALVVAASAATAGPDGLAAGALVVPAAAVSGKDLRRNFGPSIRTTLWTVRSFPGEVARLEFVPGGLRLPPNATAVEASPQPADASTLTLHPRVTLNYPGEGGAIPAGGKGTPT